MGEDERKRGREDTWKEWRERVIREGETSEIGTEREAETEGGNGERWRDRERDGGIQREMEG